MKNRYFGDIYDYIKYALLRRLMDEDGCSAAVCWMLTEDDGGKDGHRTGYLGEPARWSSFEPTIFEFLRRHVVERETRNVEAVQRSKILPNCRFYSRILTDDRVQRQRYFDQFIGFARGVELVFFDPDNGIEVKSARYGRRNSSKYLYWNEIERALRANHSLLIYQHLPPKPRGPLVRQVTKRLLQVSGGGIVYVFRTGKVAFFLMPRRGGVAQFKKGVSAVERTWNGVLTVSQYRLSTRKATMTNRSMPPKVT